MSEVNGAGYGDSHNWVHIHTNNWGATGGTAWSFYSCQDCQQRFVHYYHIQKDIFKAIQECNVTDKCTPEGKHENHNT